MPVISIARVHLRSPRYLPQFLWHTLRLAYCARKIPANLGVRLRRSRGLTFWRLTLWQGRGAMEQFRYSEQHRSVEPLAKLWFDEFALGSWEQAGSAMPEWREAISLLGRHGRLVEVDHPSIAQAEGRMELS